MDNAKEDLMKRTKAELVQTITNQKLMIEARDKKVNDMKEDLNKKINELKNDVTAKTKDVIKWKSVVESYDPTALKKLETLVGNYKEALSVVTRQRNRYRTHYGNLLKVLSGTLGQALEVNEIIDKEVEDYGKES